MVYSELTEYSFFWDIFGGKYYAAARAGRGWFPVEKNWNGNSDPFPKHEGAFFSKLKFRVFCYS